MYGMVLEGDSVVEGTTRRGVEMFGFRITPTFTAPELLPLDSVSTTAP